MASRRGKRSVRKLRTRRTNLFARLPTLASAVPQDQAIVQLGTVDEITSALRAGSQRGKGARVYAIDVTRTGQGRYGRALVPSLHAVPPWPDRLPPVIAASFHKAKRWRLPIGLLLIESGGTYEEIKAHYQEWAQHVPSGGSLVFIDEDARAETAVKSIVREMIRPGMWRTHSRGRRFLWASRR